MGFRLGLRVVLPNFVAIA